MSELCDTLNFTKKYIEYTYQYEFVHIVNAPLLKSAE